MSNTKSYREKYRSIQLNVPRQKYAKLLEWLDERAKDEDRSLNYLITKILLMEYDRDGEKDNR